MEENRGLSRSTIALHWLTGVGFIAVFVAGLIIADMDRGPDKFQFLGYHKSIGVIILVIALVRIGWRIKEGALPELAPSPRWQVIASKAVHGLLMLATLSMPISGMVMTVAGGRDVSIFGWELIAAGDKIPWLQDIASTVHFGSVKIIIAVFALHVLGALKHQLIDKDGTISRMVGREPK